MQLKETRDALNNFAKYVIQESKNNLDKSGKNFSKELYNSLGYDVKVSKNSFQLEFLMEDYGIFQDKGVKGKDPSKVSTNAKITGQQAPNSPYKFGSGNYSGQWSKFVGKLEVWAKKKNVRLRDEKGRFKKGNYKTIAQIIAGNIYNRGIKPSMFFTKPFEKAFKGLNEELIKAYALDVEKFMAATIKDNLKK
jgi:uncharacterized protein with FMN-binding domain